MELKDAIEALDKHVTDPKNGLPEELFLYVSRTTPLVNVDLLIKDEKGRTLLGWRDDKYAGRGWHVLGGIIRFKEKWEDRVKKVANKEIGTEVKFDSKPIALNQFFCPHNERGHFVSLLFKCFLDSSFILENKGLTEKDPGYLKWHEICPDNLVKCHDMYKKYINEAN